MGKGSTPTFLPSHVWKTLYLLLIPYSKKLKNGEELKRSYVLKSGLFLKSPITKFKALTIKIMTKSVQIIFVVLSLFMIHIFYILLNINIFLID